MQIFIDGKKLEDTTDVHIQLEIESIYSENRFIKEISLNGNSVSLDLFKSNPEFAEKDILEIETCSLDTLIEDSMESAYASIPLVYSKLAQIINFLRIGDISNGGARFSEVIESMQWNYTMITELTTMHPGPSAIHELQTEAANFFPTLLEAWENEDFVLLADILEFEVSTWLEKWLNIIELFRSERQLEHLKQTMQKKNLH